MTIRILLQDADFLIVEKPVGIPTQPLVSSQDISLAQEVAKQFPELLSVGGPDCGAVHRLDRDTSGLVIFARNQKTYDVLRVMFSKNQIEKEYTAIVEGFVAQPGKITWPIGPDPKSSKRVKAYRNIAEARKNKAQEAVTIYDPVDMELPARLKALGSCTGLRIRIKTGRRHQIRVHLATLGYPIVGDEIYGSGANERLYLHASRLKFRHPQDLKTPRWVEVSSAPSFAVSEAF